MAKTINEDSFLEKIKTCTKATIGAGALVFALSGCQSTATNNTYSSLHETNESQISQVAKTKMEIAAENATPLTSENFQSILENRISGVYKHPVYDDQVVTYEFDEDPNAVENIKKDLIKLGLDPDAYDSEQSLYDLITNDDDTTSRHIQNPFGSKNNDINLCKIFENNYLKAKVEISDNDEGLNDLLRAMGEEIPETVEVKIETDKSKPLNLYKDQVYNGYNLLMHEAAHSFKHQQMEMTDFANIPFSKKTLIMLENSSESFAMIKTLQLMKQNNESEDYMEGFINDRIDAGHFATKKESKFSVDKKPNKEDVHQMLPTLGIIKDIFKNDPNYLFSLNDKQSERFSEIVAKAVVDTDYIDVYKETKRQENKEFIDLFVGKIVKADILEIADYSDELKETIEKNDFNTSEKKESAIGLSRVVDAVIDNYEGIKDNRVSLEDIKQIATEKIIKDIEELRIDDYDNNHLLSEINFEINTFKTDGASFKENLHTKIVDNLLDSKMPIPVEAFATVEENLSINSELVSSKKNRISLK